MAVSESPAIIVESIAINAPITAVFAALTVPEQLVQWWGAKNSTGVTAMESDLRPGGAWKMEGNGTDGDTFTTSGTYRVVDAPRMLETTWTSVWSDGTKVPETLVRYELNERDGVTNLTVTHSGFTAASDREDHARGWKSVLGWLRDFVTKQA